jgi:hypothetical protein
MRSKYINKALSISLLAGFLMLSGCSAMSKLDDETGVAVTETQI